MKGEPIPLGVYLLTRGEAEALLAFTNTKDDWDETFARREAMVVWFEDAVAMATDTYGAISLPVIVEGRPGPLCMRAAALYRASRTMKPGDVLEVRPDCIVNLSDGVTVPYLSEHVKRPDFKVIMPGADEYNSSVVIDADYLERIAKAAKRLKGGKASIRIRATDSRRAVRFDIGRFGETTFDKPDTPLVAQMPMLEGGER